MLTKYSENAAQPGKPAPTKGNASTPKDASCHKDATQPKDASQPKGATRIITLFLIIISGIIFNNILYAQDISKNSDKEHSNWLETSSSKDDIIISDYFDAINLEEKISAIPYIAKRKDRNFSFLLDKIYYQENDNKSEKEYILFLMLDNFFNDAESVEMSKDSFFIVCENIANYRNSILRKKIMEKTALLDKKMAENILLKEALFLLEEGSKSKKFNTEMLEESRIFFIYSEKIDSPVLNDYRQEIYVAVSNIPDKFLDSVSVQNDSVGAE